MPSPRQVGPRAGGPRAVGRRALLAGLGGATALLLAACGNDDGSDPAASDAPAAGGSSGAPDGAGASDGGGAQSGASLEIRDAWAKAADTEDADMTSVFAQLHNTGSETITLISAQSDAAAEVQLHESAPDGNGGMSMSEKEGGFPIEPGATLELAPGGDHLMLMGLTRPIQPGDTVTITLRFDDDSTVELEAVAKEFAGANESYGSDGGGH